MGLESYNLGYRPANENDIPAIFMSLVKDYNAIQKLSGETKYIIKSDSYLIDLLHFHSTISIRIALCCSEAAIFKVIEMIQDLSVKFGGLFFDQHLKLKVTNFTQFDIAQILVSYRNRQDFFRDHLADLRDNPLSADEVYRYIRDNNLKPRGRG